MRNAVSSVAAAFSRVKWSIGLDRLDAREPGQLTSAARFFLYRLALGAHVAHHAANLPHADAVGDFDLDLVVVNHFGDFADQAAGGDDRVPAPHVLDHFLMRLHPLLLRAQNEEIHDY